MVVDAAATVNVTGIVLEVAPVALNVIVVLYVPVLSEPVAMATVMKLPL